MKIEKVPATSPVYQIVERSEVRDGVKTILSSTRIDIENAKPTTWNIIGISEEDFGILGHLKDGYMLKGGCSHIADFTRLGEIFEDAINTNR